MVKIPTIVIIGRINAGKSTLFNLLTESKNAIVSDTPGTTRDYNLGQIIWRGRALDIIDTGGVDIDTLKNSIKAIAQKKPYKTKDSIEKNIISQTQNALKKAELIIFLVDGKAGLLAPDKSLALILKSAFRGKPIILAVNKIDKPSHQEKINEFYKLGFGSPVPISAANGSGTGDLLDEIFKKLRLKKTKTALVEKSKNATKIVLIGKPNTGKSSLMNRLAGEERVIVSEIAQTTREPQDVFINYKNHALLFTDTAGLKRKRPKERIEKLASIYSLSKLKQADIALFVIEAQMPLTNQDVRIAGQIKKAKLKPIIIANKWDLVKDKDTKIEKKFTDYIKHQLPPLKKAPIIFLSALTGKNIDRVLNTISKIINESE